MGRGLNRLAPATIAILEAYFRGPAAAWAFGAEALAEREAAEARREAERAEHRDGRSPECAADGAAEAGPGSAAAAAPRSPAGRPASRVTAEAELPRDSEAEERARRRRPWRGYDGAVRWRVQAGTAVDATGGSEAAGARLQPVGLDKQQW